MQLVKMRGKKRWQRETKGIVFEVMSLERKLDSLHQKSIWAKKGNGYELDFNKLEEDLSKALGMIRRIWAIVGFEQKALKRWTKPAPNQMEEYEKCVSEK